MKEVKSSLVKRIKSGDEYAFAELFRELKDPLFRFANSICHSTEEAEDILQEVFITVWQQKEKLGAISNLNAFIFVIAKNKALDYLRKKTTYLDINNEPNFEHAYNNDPFSILKHKELQECVYHAVANLPQKQRIVYQMFKEEEMPQKDIANRLNVSVSTVKNQVMQAISNIKKNIFF